MGCVWVVYGLCVGCEWVVDDYKELMNKKNRIISVVKCTDKLRTITVSLFIHYFFQYFYYYLY